MIQKKAAPLKKAPGRADKRPHEEKIRELYYAVYSREPEADELALAVGHLEKKTKGKEGKPEEATALRQAYEDIIWALVNTKEFVFNH